MDDVQKQVEALLSEAEAVCRREGTQFTRLRRLILETLARSPGPVKAYDLLESLKEKGRRLTPSSVYRTLEFFIRKGLVHRVSSLNSYVACADGGSLHNPVLLVCPDCQAITEINDEALNYSIFSRLNRLGFSARMASVEVTGLCEKCQKEPSEKGAD
ncbi:MAG: transcriptional repressor [Deltaproteobacteria bacterium]|jgi:Fur family zinc uptake transcriptional regulator|nr:transcriptional repressor [Deltaproteobacteria bacterium]